MSDLIVYYLSLVCYIVGINSNPNSIIVPCKLNDEECMTKSANIAARLIAPGIPSLGIEPLDPIRHDLVEINNPTIKLAFRDVTVTGFSKCVVTNAKLNLDSLNLKCNLTCRSIEFNGNYFISGTLLSLPLEGEGKSKTFIGTYLISVDAEMKRVTGKDGKTYLAVKKATHVGDAIEPVKFQYDNLFNGQKELSEAAHAFAHENYKEIIKLLQDKFLAANFKHIFINVNKLLKTTPIENLFIK